MRSRFILVVIGALALPFATMSGTSAEEKIVIMAPAGEPNAFRPVNVEITVGDTIVWRNDDNEEHTVTSDTGDPKFQGKDSVGAGQRHSFTPAEAATFPYHCELHTMRGTIAVKAKMP